MSATLQANTFDILVTVVPIIVPFLIVLAAYTYNKIMQSLPLNQQKIVQAFATQAVHAVEQMLPNEAGAQKKYVALQNLVKTLAQHGIKPDTSTLEMALEAAVFAMNQNGQARTAMRPALPALPALPAIRPTPTSTATNMTAKSTG